MNICVDMSLHAHVFSFLLGKCPNEVAGTVSYSMCISSFRRDSKIFSKEIVTF